MESEEMKLEFGIVCQAENTQNLCELGSLVSVSSSCLNLRDLFIRLYFKYLDFR